MTVFTDTFNTQKVSIMIFQEYLTLHILTIQH